MWERQNMEKVHFQLPHAQDQMVCTMEVALLLMAFVVVRYIPVGTWT